mgnify:CR=1 FL=1
MRSACVQFNFIPKLRVEVVFHVKQINLIYVPAHKLVDETAVEFEVGAFGGGPKLRLEG